MEKNTLFYRNNQSFIVESPTHFEHGLNDKSLGVLPMILRNFKEISFWDLILRKGRAKFVFYKFRILYYKKPLKNLSEC